MYNKCTIKISKMTESNMCWKLKYTYIDLQITTDVIHFTINKYQPMLDKSISFGSTCTCFKNHMNVNVNVKWNMNYEVSND